MIPVLFSALTTDFSTFGIGHLSDAISPHVVEERNGEYTLEMQYPIDGEHYDDIALRCIITAKPSPAQDVQPFRIYRITKPINGIVTIYARHVRYDLEGVPVVPFTASGISNAMTAIKNNSLVSNPFTFTTNKTNTQTFTLKTPSSALSLMGGTIGSLLDIYGGEYKYNVWNVHLMQNRGTDNGVVIRYGVDLTDFQQDEHCANVYTAVMCYWKSMQDDTLVTGEQQSAGTFDYERVLVVDRSQNYENAPTVAQLNQDAVNYINNNKVGVPTVAINLSFANLEQTEEYKNIRQSIELCDQITVEFVKLGVSAMSRIIRTDYDVMNERYISVDIGDSRTSLADTYIAVESKADKAPTSEQMQQAINATTAAITGANGGAVRLLDTNDDDLPDTLYIADNPSPLLASKVWRFNYEGWGASQNGYSGPFTMGATFAQGFLAEFITAGYLSADRIKAGTIATDKLTTTAQSQIVTSVSTKTQYYLSTSASSATGGSWSDSVPTWSSGKYLWTRAVTTRTFIDNTSETTYAPSSNGTYDRNLTSALSTASSASSTAASANAKEQLIYISKPSGTVSVTAPTAWVTRATDVQDVWTVFRPKYNSSYPVLFVATQRQTVGGTVTCTTPMRDETTTVIDGGHITTGTIDANRVTVTNINASNINAGTLSADRIDANSIAVAKLTGKIKAGLSDSWVLDLDAGTFTIGTLSASNLTSGTIDASDITVKNLSADNITAGTLNGERIGKGTITGGVDSLGRATGNLAVETIVGSNIGKGQITGGTDAYGRATGNIALKTITGGTYGNIELGTITGGADAWGSAAGNISLETVSTANTVPDINTSLGFADFSNEAFFHDEAVDYINTKYLKVSEGFNMAGNLSVGGQFFLAYGQSRYNAQWMSQSITLAASFAFKATDQGGNERWVNAYATTAASISPNWVVGNNFT